jgi:hypothetical protein
MNHTLPFRKVYGPVIEISIITIYGLLSALLGDGIWDELSWIAMVIPLVVIAWKYGRGSASPSRKIEGGGT